MFIRRRSREWPSAAAAFTPRTAVSIVTVNRSAPITPPPISSANGAGAGAPRVIISSIDRSCSAKCAWGRIFPISASARPPKKKTRRLLRVRVPQALPPDRPLLLPENRLRLLPLLSQRILLLRRHLPRLLKQSLESQRGIQPPGIIYIFILHARSHPRTGTRICRPIAFFMRNAVLRASVPRTR